MKEILKVDFEIVQYAIWLFSGRDSDPKICVYIIIFILIICLKLIVLEKE